MVPNRCCKSWLNYLSHARCLSVQLIAVYARVVNESDGDLDSEKLFDQGYHILAPIIKLLDACSNIPSILAAFEELLEPLIRDICSRDTEALFEQVTSSDLDALTPQFTHNELLLGQGILRACVVL